MLERIADLIEAELDHPSGSTYAENLRAAAWYVMDELPQATSADFGDAAELLGLHRQGARNRWNEAVANLKIANGE